MREIKFRAWDKTHNKWCDCSPSVGWVLNTDTNEINISFYGTTDGNIELMQYTGLKDKNGREIYEGDILKGKSYLYGYQLEPYGEQFDYFGVVKWQSQCDVGLCWILEDTKGGAWDLNQTVHRNAIDYCTGEVIGNIYENPELLEATND